MSEATRAVKNGILRPALTIFVALTLVAGVLYPLATTVVAQLAFKDQANGSLIEQGGQVVGSALIGQPFSEPRYFWGRLSATAPMPYNAAASSGSNLGPRNPALAAAAQARIDALKAADPTNTAPIPVDLVSASGSGLDPHISAAAARYQMARVAAARGVQVADVERLVNAHTDVPLFGVLGTPAVNVLMLNLALDRAKGGKLVGAL